MTVIKAATVPRLGRGGGVETIPLITRQSAAEENKITTGISSYPPGTGAPLHLHNCDEHVTLLAGAAEVEIAGQVTALEPDDTTYVAAGIVHAFRNTGDTPGEDPLGVQLGLRHAHVRGHRGDGGAPVPGRPDGPRRLSFPAARTLSISAAPSCLAGPRR
ncbi:MAG TPA: cupin domain-containing protein [Streptosporangiaceae bacterium]|nr:cupin domain-containing protein [Streptosporangiaceae bacterium]